MSNGFTEPRPDLITANPGGAEDPLGESVLDKAQPWVRVFEPRDVRVVIGRHQDPQREVSCDRARTDGVPIHRRVSGGGAVVLAPGMVVVALRLEPGAVDPSAWFCAINRALIPAIADAIGVQPGSHRLGDLWLPGDDGMPRKVLGASLRQTSRLVAYLGVMLVHDAVPLMERYLRQPSREPDYRSGRGHGAFCTGLAAHGATVPMLIAAVSARCSAGLVGEVPPICPR